MTHAVRLGLHIAHLDPAAGYGVLVMPRHQDDVFLMGSLNGADFDSAVRALASLGWEPLLDDDDLWIVEGQTPQGCPVIALYGIEAVLDSPTMDHLADARTALLDAAGAAS